MKQTAKSRIREAHYSGELPNFRMNTYYTVFATAFNDLEEAGEAKTEDAKISDFRLGILLVDNQAINCCSQADAEFKQLPVEEQTFESFYNLMKGKLDTHITQRTVAQHHTGNTRTSTIQNLNSDQGRGRGRGGHGNNSFGGHGYGGPYNGGRNFGGRQHGGHGRGGRGASFYNARQPFYPQLKIYPRDEWSNMNCDQKMIAEQLKINNGWKNGTTPPDGYIINEVTGQAVALTASNRSIGQVSYSYAPLPPVPTNAPVPPPGGPPQVPNAIQVPQGSAGLVFGCHQNGEDQGSVISRVSIDGRTYFSGPIHDVSGNQIS